MASRKRKPKKRKTDDWIEEIRGARERVGVTAEQYPMRVMLAFIDVESDGDPNANRPGSQFHGLLQMGKMAGLDVGLDDVSVLQGEDGDPHSEDDIEKFFELCEKYKSRHDYHPYRIAALWKGGAGTAKTVGKLMAEGEDFNFALAAAETRHEIHNLREYVRRFRKALIHWTRELESRDFQDGPPPKPEEAAECSK